MAQAEVVALEEAQAAVEQAWQRLNELHHDLPDCEHVRAWRADLATAHREHQERLRARGRAFAAVYPQGLPEAGTSIR